MNNIAYSFLFLVANIVFVSPASAALWKISYFGTLTDVSAADSTPLSVGNEFTGFIVVDDSAPPSGEPLPDRLRYDAIIDSRLVIPDISADFRQAADRRQAVFVINDNPRSGDDEFSFFPTYDVGAGNPGSANLGFAAFDTDSSVFDDRSLTSVIDILISDGLVDFEQIVLLLTFADDGIWGSCNFLVGCNLFARLDSFSIEPAVVPLPASFLFLFTGLLGVAFTRKQPHN